MNFSYIKFPQLPKEYIQSLGFDTNADYQTVRTFCLENQL